MIRYTSVNQGDDRNRLLHSVPYGNSRTNVSVYVSYDEGESWPVRKCIVPYSSAYSSLCILPDGTIGLYVEEAYAGASGYSTVFYNFSLEWLTDGDDTYDPTGIAEKPIVTETLRLYPVPSSSCIVIEGDAIYTVSIYTLGGQCVKSLSGNKTSSLVMDISDLNPGIYEVRMVNVSGKNSIGKIVKY